jgi:hypothetical protein
VVVLLDLGEVVVLHFSAVVALVEQAVRILLGVVDMVLGVEVVHIVDGTHEQVLLVALVYVIYGFKEV